MLWLQRYDLIRSHWTSQSFSEHLCQADLSMLALRVVTARVLVVLSGSFTFQIETEPTLTRFSDSQRIQRPQCWEPGFKAKYTMGHEPGLGVSQADVFTIALSAPLCNLHLSEPAQQPVSSRQHWRHIFLKLTLSDRPTCGLSLGHVVDCIHFMILTHFLNILLLLYVHF